MQRSLIAACIGIICLLAGCATLTGQHALPVVVSPQPALLNKRISHLVEWQAVDNAETFIAVLEPQQDKIQLVAVMPAGISLFSLTHARDVQTLDTSALYSRTIRPNDLLGILQLVNYPLAELAQQLPEHWHLKESGQQRLLDYHEDTIISVQFTGDRPEQPVVVKNLEQDYTLTITRLAIEDIP